MQLKTFLFSFASSQAQLADDGVRNTFHVLEWFSIDLYNLMYIFIIYTFSNHFFSLL